MAFAADDARLVPRGLMLRAGIGGLLALLLFDVPNRRFEFRRAGEEFPPIEWPDVMFRRVLTPPAGIERTNAMMSAISCQSGRRIRIDGIATTLLAVGPHAERTMRARSSSE